MFGAFEEPYIENWIVGPLPISESTTAKADDYYITKSTSKMPMRSADDDKVYEFIYELAAGVQDIVMDLTGLLVRI
jgi:primary-amine oxidase